MKQLYLMFSILFVTILAEGCKKRDDQGEMINNCSYGNSTFHAQMVKTDTTFGNGVALFGFDDSVTHASGIEIWMKSFPLEAQSVYKIVENPSNSGELQVQVWDSKGLGHLYGSSDFSGGRAIVRYVGGKLDITIENTSIYRYSFFEPIDTISLNTRMIEN